MPFIFVLDPLGTGLLLSIPKGGSWLDVIKITVLAMIALVAFAGAAEGWLLKKTPAWQRLMLLVAGLLLLVPTFLYDAIGIALLIFVIAIQCLEPRARAVN